MSPTCRTRSTLGSALIEAMNAAGRLVSLLSVGLVPYGASRGRPQRARSAGVEPDRNVPDPVVAGLARDGFDVRGYVPRPVSSERVGPGDRIVSFACEIPPGA